MKTTASRIVIGLTLCAFGAAHAQITGTIESGYDSNPFRLSDELKTEEAGFVDAELRLEQDLGNGFAVDVRARARKHGDNARDADSTIYSAILEYNKTGSLFSKVANFDARVRLAGRDATFVSRITGDVGQFAGQDIGDRFDSQSLEARLRTDIFLSDTTSLRLQLDGRQREYEDFTAIGLSNLDYDQLISSAVLRFRPDKNNDLQFRGAYGKRHYDDRRGRDLGGTFVLGSDLKYEYAEFGASWKRDLTKNQDIRFSFDHKIRTDNVTGYYDTTLNDLALRHRYEIDKQSRLTTTISYLDFEYDNIPQSAILNNEESVGPRNGPSYSLRYQRTLSETETAEVSIDAEVAYDDFDSSNVDYEYDRMVAKVGLSVEF